MRTFKRIAVVPALLFGLGLVTAGCEPADQAKYDSTVDNFDGQITHNGEPVSFADMENVKLQLLYLETAEHFGVPIKPDGTFDIGWMPIGDYSATLEWKNTSTDRNREGGPATHGVPGGLTVLEGKTEYTVELGENWKP